jgi:hypothetical protein
MISRAAATAGTFGWKSGWGAGTRRLEGSWQQVTAVGAAGTHPTTTARGTPLVDRWGVGTAGSSGPPAE